MKKFVIIILLILPIFLMVTISLVGQVLATITYINVESVAFVDELEYDVSTIKVGKGKDLMLKVLVLPELANNKSLVYSCDDLSIATVDNTGKLTGVNYGYATLIVESVDGKKTDRVTVNVTDDNVAGVDIHLTEKVLHLHEEHTLTHSVYPLTALDKFVTWTSSNPEYVEVSETTGVLTAKKITEEGVKVTITATSRDGGFTDTCEVTVIPYLLAFLPQINEGVSSYNHNSLTLDLMSFITYDGTKISEDDIQFSLDMGQNYASISDNVLTFNEKHAGQIVRLVCKAVNEDVNVEIKIILRYVED